MKVKLLATGTLAGVWWYPGDVIDIPEDSAATLVSEGRAVYFTSDANTAPSQDDSPPVGIPGTEKEKDAVSEALELDLVKKALGDAYKKDDLAKQAKAAGVAFAYDAKKAEIIEAIIAADAAKVVLDAWGLTKP